MAKGTENLVNLAKEALHSEDAAVELMIRLRWPNGAACPMCGGADPYRLKPKAQPGRPARRGLFKCSACKRQFSVTTGSVFEASHLPLSKWLMAIHLMSASKKGMSAHQLHRMLGITYRAAWFAFHRLRYAMSTNADLFAKLSGTVEVDESSSPSRWAPCLRIRGFRSPSGCWPFTCWRPARRASVPTSCTVTWVSPTRPRGSWRTVCATR